MGWIQTHTGVRIDPLSPHLQPEQIELADIAHALSNLCRFNGHTRHFYSVAEHSVRVMFALAWDAKQGVVELPDLGRSGDILAYRVALLHDAHEAYMGDCPRPFKTDERRRAEDRLQAVIWDRFGVPAQAVGLMAPLVRKYDDILLATEARDLIGQDTCGTTDWCLSEQAMDETLDNTFAPDQAKCLFLHQAEQIGLADYKADGSPA